VSRERADIGRGLTPDAGVVGDVQQTVDAFIHWLDEAEIGASGFAQEVLAAGTTGAPSKAAATQAGGTVDYVEALSALNRILPANRMLVTDAGRFLIKAFQMLDVETPRFFLQTAAFGSIGLGMACAIGAGAAEPQRPVVLVTGDGGFMLGGMQEFHSAVRNRSDLIVLVCNDGSYGAEHVQLRDKQMDPAIVMFSWPDFARVAETLGGTGVTVRSMDDMAEVERAVAERARPLLIDLRLDPDNVPFH
jgi:thiamine pyrophosphate-dependent acetolactate synthase large subunit-like protein